MGSLRRRYPRTFLLITLIGGSSAGVLAGTVTALRPWLLFLLALWAFQIAGSLWRSGRAPTPEFVFFPQLEGMVAATNRQLPILAPLVALVGVILIVVALGSL